ncbi:MAG TPA: hypothetical protein VGG08_10025 [Solirubrobacteraceae bacterium]|jgi:hypothetical protein
MTDSLTSVLESLRPCEAAMSAEIFPASRREQMLAEICAGAEPRRPVVRARRRLLPAAALAATALGLAVLLLVAGLPGAGTQRASSAIAFRTAADGDVIATVEEPFAAQSQLERAFARRGFDIQVSLVPVSPSLVGTLVYASEEDGADSIQPLLRGPCLAGGAGCSVGVRILSSFKGRGYITLGRAARADEAYDSTASAFAPGEPLHCSGLLGARVGSALPRLERDRLRAQWREEVSVGSSSRSRTLSAPPSGSYIWEATLSTPDKLVVFTEPTPWPADARHGAHDNDGC